MKKLGTLSFVLAVALSTTGCLSTYAGGLGPEQRWRTGFGAKTDIQLYGNTVELVISTANNRRVERFEPLLRDFLEAALITKGAEPVKTGGQIKMSVTITDIQTAIIVTMKLAQEGRGPTVVTEECGIPSYESRAQNISLDEYFLNAFKYAARKAVNFL